MLGHVLKSRYKLIDERGSGSMATVYVGRDLETNRLYAVKVLSRQAAAEKELVERFQREFELLSRLSGPHVVSPVDFGDDRGSLFIVMDYVDGHTLKHAVLTGGPFATARALDVTQQATSGVAAAADRGVVHRDVKPQNLLLTADGVVKLTDFGLARSHESRDITVTGFFVGTPFYVAPEQVENSRGADVRADLYSLACVFFELLAGRVPFDGEHAWDVVMQHLNGPIPSLCALRPDLPPEYDVFMVRALAKKPGDRFQSPLEFMEALDDLFVLGTTSHEPANDIAVATAVLVAPVEGLRFALPSPDLVAGRRDPQRGFKPDIDLLSIDHQQTVSRRHARFTRRAGRFFIEDLNAYNRTRVNGLPLVPHQEHELHHGDMVRLGNVELQFEVGPHHLEGKGTES
ncbi:MAG TPA: FHA domain-containing serine/threonine-protein kinase [Ktedonobacterales bacterium]|jgi:serine/threonine-protein kinase|nr:FHA domain-containing serine/threonine-protein kinase [Ktedonobacterales bacterium]